MPHVERIQASFGPHDVSGVTAHQGPEARQAAGALGAQAFAFGNAVAFASSPDLHTAAHEAAHVVQQRGSGGVQIKGNIDQPGDAYERHADAVADRVGAGQSAESLLDQMAGGSGAAAVVQRRSEPGARVTATEYLKLNDRAAGDSPTSSTRRSRSRRPSQSRSPQVSGSGRSSTSGSARRPTASCGTGCARRRRSTRSSKKSRRSCSTTPPRATARSTGTISHSR